MAVPRAQGDERRAARPLSYRMLTRAVLAACIVLAPLVIFLGFVVDPTHGVPQGSGDIYTAFRAADPQRVQWFLFFNAVTTYFFAPSFLGLGLLAMRRSPWLATIGTIFGLIGSLPWAFFIGPESQSAVMAQLGDRQAFIAAFDHVSAEGVVLPLQLSWVIGHLLGYLLLGIALGRAKVVPLWAAALIVVSVPFQMAAYPTHQGMLQILGFIFVFAGSIPAALALLTMRDENSMTTKEAAQ